MKPDERQLILFMKAEFQRNSTKTINMLQHLHKFEWKHLLFTFACFSFHSKQHLNGEETKRPGALQQ